MLTSREVVYLEERISAFRKRASQMRRLATRHLEYDVSRAEGDTLVEKLESLHELLEQMYSVPDGPNWMLTSPEVAAVLQVTGPGYEERHPVPNHLGPRLHGTYSRWLKVYIDPLYTRDRCLLGRCTGGNPFNGTSENLAVLKLSGIF